MHVAADAVRDVLLDAAAECHVQHLGAAADREHRQVARERGLHQRELEVVALADDPDRLGVRVGAVQLWIEVGSAGEDQPVDCVERLVDRRAGRHEQRDAAGVGDGLHIRRRYEGSVDVPRAPRSARQVRRDADDRLTHVRRDAPAPTT